MEAAQQGGAAGGDNVLHELARKMDDVQEKLDRERIGAPTVVEQEQILDVLNKIVEKLESQQGQKSKSQCKKCNGKDPKCSECQGQGQGQKGGPQKGKGKGQGKGQAPMQNSQATSGSAGASSRAVVEGFGARWGELPQKARDEIMHALNEGYPERYKELLKKYYRELARDADEQE